MMVFYSIETGSRNKIYFSLAVLAIALSSILIFFEQYIGCHALAPSALMIYFGLTALYDKYLWVWPIIDKFTDIPNLNGCWEGHLVRNKGKENIPITLLITQTWKKIDLVLEAQHTISETISATMFVENRRKVRILWTYLVRNKTMLESTNLYGEGITDLRFSIKQDDIETLEGTYFSSKLRKGHISVSRISR